MTNLHTFPIITSVLCTNSRIYNLPFDVTRSHSAKPPSFPIYLSTRYYNIPPKTPVCQHSACNDLLVIVRE